MAIAPKDVTKVAHLARIAIEQADIEAYTHDLGNILSLVDQMQNVDTDAIEPMAHPLNTTQRLRADKVTEADQREAFQTIAPATEAGLYLVPKVID